MPENTAQTRQAGTRTVAFMNQKGGVGKTTTVVNLAAAVAESGRRVLVIDLDPQAHATLHLGIEPDALEVSLYDVLHDPSRVGEAIVTTRERLDLLPSIVDLAAAEPELASADDRHARMSRALAHVAESYDFILIDCPPSLGLLTLNGLTAAGEVVIPMQAHFLALQGVGKLFETVRLIAQDVNPKLRVAGVVLCMHEEQTRHAKEVVADLETFFAEAAGGDEPWSSARVYRPAIRRNIKVAESPSFGQTLFEYARWCAGAMDYRAIAESFVQEWEQRPAETVEAADVETAAPAVQEATHEVSEEPIDASDSEASEPPAEELAETSDTPATPFVDAPEVVVRRAAVADHEPVR